MYGALGQNPSPWGGEGGGGEVDSVLGTQSASPPTPLIDDAGIVIQDGIYGDTRTGPLPQGGRSKGVRQARGRGVERCEPHAVSGAFRGVAHRWPPRRLS